MKLGVRQILASKVGSCCTTFWGMFLCFFASQECGKGKGKWHDNAWHPRLQNAGALFADSDGIVLQSFLFHLFGGGSLSFFLQGTVHSCVNSQRNSIEGDTAVLMGQVKSFDENKNYGFIACDLVSSVYFGHRDYEIVFIILDILW